jgi:hypothetical protein
MIASIGFAKVGDEYKAFIHWVFIPPRRSWAPLPDTIQEYEIGAEEKANIKDSLSTQVINKLSTVGLKAQLKELGIRAPANDQATMKQTLKRVLQRGSRSEELRIRGKGRPNRGGECTPPTGNTRMVSEYLHECLVPFMEGEELLNEEGEECDLTADEGIRGCPDF